MTRFEVNLRHGLMIDLSSAWPLPICTRRDNIRNQVLPVEPSNGEDLTNSHLNLTSSLSANSYWHYQTLQMAPNNKLPKLNGTQLIHGDSRFAGPEVAPSISVTTSELFRTRAGKWCMIICSSPAFRSQNPLKDEVSDVLDLRNPVNHVYSRYTQQVSTRAEHILSQINVWIMRESQSLVLKNICPGRLCTHLFIWSRCILCCKPVFLVTNTRQWQRVLNRFTGSCFLWSKEDCY